MLTKHFRSKLFDDSDSVYRGKTATYGFIIKWILSFCKENETLLHLFVHCKFVDSVWIEVFDKFNDFFLRKFNILAENLKKIYV